MPQQVNKSAIAGIVLAAVAVVIPISKGFEGEKLKSYPDINGKPTVCYGETDNVKLGNNYTFHECDAMLGQHILKEAEYVSRETSGHKITANQLAAYTDFTYNLGEQAFKNSGVLRYIQNRIKSCNYILKYKYAGGKDCSIRANNCYGIIIRRQAERDLCLKP